MPRQQVREAVPNSSYAVPILLFVFGQRFISRRLEQEDTRRVPAIIGRKAIFGPDRHQLLVGSLQLRSNLRLPTPPRDHRRDLRDGIPSLVCEESDETAGANDQRREDVRRVPRESKPAPSHRDEY